MDTQLKASIVRIFATRGDIVGMGFLASERSILSCAHVITAALSIAEETPDVPTTAISLDFPLIAPGCYLTAHVSFWQPSQPNGGGDIAVLQLDDAAPAGAEAVHLVSAEDVAKMKRSESAVSLYRWSDPANIQRTRAAWQHAENSAKKVGYGPAGSLINAWLSRTSPRMVKKQQRSSMKP